MIDERAAFVGAMKIDSKNANNNSDIKKSHISSRAITEALSGRVRDEMCHHKQREEYQDIIGGHDARNQYTWRNMPFDAPDESVRDENDTLKALFNFADASLQRNMSMILDAIERDDREANTDKLREVRRFFPKTSLDYFMDKSNTGSGNGLFHDLCSKLTFVVGSWQPTKHRMIDDKWRHERPEQMILEQLFADEDFQDHSSWEGVDSDEWFGYTQEEEDVAEQQANYKVPSSTLKQNEESMLINEHLRSICLQKKNGKRLYYFRCKFGCKRNDPHFKRYH